MNAIRMSLTDRAVSAPAGPRESAARAGPLRLLTFTSLFPNSVQPTHGLFVLRRLKELESTGGIEPTVVAPVPWVPSGSGRLGRYAEFARVPSREQWEGFDVLHPRHLVLPKVGMTLAPALMAAGVFRTVAALHRERRFDLIDAHYFYPDGVAAAWLARRLGLPLTITARGTDLNLIAEFRVPRRQIRWAAGVSQLNITVSRALAERLAAIGSDVGKLRVLPNGVDLAHFRPYPVEESRRLLGFGDEPLLLAVGQLLESKGHEIAIRALTHLGACHLVIAGQGPDEARLRGIAQACGVAGRVTFAGRIDPGQLPRYYSAADLLVLPSEREGLPNVLLESLACGTPVIASTVGGCPEVVSEPVAGRLLDSRDPQCLARAVADLLAQRPDRAEVRRFAERFGWRDSVAAQLAEYRRIAHGVAR